MFKLVALAASVAVFFQSSVCQAEVQPAPPPDQEQSDQVLDDAAVIALIIAGSVAMYKAMGRPCACPTDLTRNGQRCGKRSAWSRGGGARPLCSPTDVTPSMIQNYRKTKVIPSLW